VAAVQLVQPPAVSASLLGVAKVAVGLPPYASYLWLGAGVTW
jgi:hypothetical protein